MDYNLQAIVWNLMPRDRHAVRAWEAGLAGSVILPILRPPHHGLMFMILIRCESLLRILRQHGKQHGTCRWRT